MLVRSLVLLALVVLALPAHADRAADEAAAREVFQRNVRAIAERDLDAYLDCYLHSDDLTIVGFSGVQFGYEGWAAGIDTDEWPDAIDAFGLMVHGVTDGVVYGQYRFRVRYGEDVQEGVSQRIFVRTDEGWRIVLTSAFQAPEGVLAPPDEDAEEGR